MERARGDEEDMVGLDHSVLGIHRRALDQRQQVSLHALAGHVRAVRFGAACHLVQFVEEHDAVLFHGFQRLRLELLLVDELRSLLVRQLLQRVADLELAGLAAIAAEVLEHALQLARHLFHARRCHDLYADRHSLDLDFDLLVIELAFAKHLPEFLPRVAVATARVGLGRETNAVRGRWQQGIEYAFLGRILGAVPHLRHRVFADHLDGDVR